MNASTIILDGHPSVFTPTIHTYDADVDKTRMIYILVTLLTIGNWSVIMRRNATSRSMVDLHGGQYTRTMSNQLGFKHKQ